MTCPRGIGKYMLRYTVESAEFQFWFTIHVALTGFEASIFDEMPRLEVIQLIGKVAYSCQDNAQHVSMD